MKLSEFFDIDMKEEGVFKLFDGRGNVVYAEGTGGWVIKGYDGDHNEVYYKDDNGFVDDRRPKKSEPAVEMTMAQICEELGKEVKIVE